MILCPNDESQLYTLLLYSRQGCCLCKGLEEHLLSLNLFAFSPPLQLSVIDIDAPSTPTKLRCRYDLLVPVLAVDYAGIFRELPRVSPRLTGEQLNSWLQRSCAAAYNL